MSDSHPIESWAARERLFFIERALYWRGWVKRRDLSEGFGISLAQASADLQRYQERNPAAACYDLSAKRYRGTSEMRCVLHEPRLEEAMAFFLDGASAGSLSLARADPPRTPGETGESGIRIAAVTLPLRRAPALVERAAFQSVRHGLRWRVRYGSLSGRKREADERTILPHAFAHDGYRWHLRAWCEENGDFRDFVLGRIVSCDWPTESVSPPEIDEAWHTWDELRLVPNPDLPREQQKAIEADFGMDGGRLILSVRRAMRDYTLAHLRLPAWDGTDRPPFLVVDRR